MTKKHNIKVTLKVLRLFDKKSEAQTMKHLLTRTAPLLVSFLIACFVRKDIVETIHYGARLLISIPMALCITKAKVKKTVSKMVVKGLWVRRLAQRTPWGVFFILKLSKRQIKIKRIVLFPHCLNAILNIV